MDSTDDLPLTTSIPIFGRLVYGLGRNASYAAAKKGDIPTIDVAGSNGFRFVWR